MNILDDLMDGLGPFGRRSPSYFHLVPTTTEQPLDLEEFMPFDDMDAFDGEDDEEMMTDLGSWNWMDLGHLAMDKARGCHQKMKGLKEWYFGGDGEVMPYSTFSTTKEMEIVIEFGDLEEDDSMEEALVYGEDMYFGIASMVMMMVTLFGILYSCYRFRVARLQMKRRYDPNDYIIMHETDQFQTTTSGEAE